MKHLILGITGASGAWAARLLAEKSQWPIALVASRMGRLVYEQEVGAFSELEAHAAEVWDEGDLTAPMASGSVPAAGMVILPCSANTLGKVAAGISDSLLTRAAHCQLKEGRRTVFCVREAPWTRMNLQNAERIAGAGGTIMPLSPPCYMVKGRDLNAVSMAEMLGYYVDHILSLLGQEAPQTWKDVR